MELEVVAELATDDGTLAESFPALLRSGRGESVELVGAFDAAALGGTLSFEPSFEINGGNAAWADAEFIGFLVQAVFTPQGSYGRLSAHTSSGADLLQAQRPLGAPVALVAEWPADAGCRAAPSWWELTSNLEIGGNVVVLGQSADAWRGLFDGLPSLTLSWNDGSSSALTASVEVNSQACFWSDAYEGDDRLGYGVRLRATGDDDSLSGQYDGFVRVAKPTAVPPEAIGHRVAMLTVRASAPVEELASLGGAKAAAAEREAAAASALSRLSLTVNLVVDLDAQQLGGDVRVRGQRDISCLDENDQTLDEELLRATVTPGR